MSDLESLAHIKAFRQDDRLGATHRTDDPNQHHYR